MALSNARRLARIMRRMERSDADAATGYTQLKATVDTPTLTAYSDDIYVMDNVFAGRYINDEGVATYRGGDNGFFCYTIDPIAGDALYSKFIASDSTDPEGSVIYMNTREVRDQCDGGTNAPTFAGAFQIERDGGLYTWDGHSAGRMRYDDDGTTNAYRAGDNSITTYSSTGATGGHGANFARGYTQIIARETSNTDDVFVVFTGHDVNGVGGQMTIEFDANGNGYFDGGADVGAADYAEYFEWADGNPDNEDRRGKSVVLTDNGTIRVATPEDSDEDYLGIVSVQPGVVGDSAWACWSGKWERDKFGQFVLEDYNLTCWGKYNEHSNVWEHSYTDEQIAEGATPEIPEDAQVIVKQRKKWSKDFDPEREYVARKDRPEWEAIGMMGKLPLLKGEPTKSTWRKLFDLNDEVEMWLVR